MKLNTKTPYPKDSYYKVNYSSNYADEFDVNGFQVFSGEELNSFVNDIKKTFKEGEYTHNIGTNECIEYSTMKDLVATFTVQKLTETQYKVLDELDLLSTGMFPDIDDFSYEDEEELSSDSSSSSEDEDSDQDANDTFVLIERRMKSDSSKLDIAVTYDPTSCFTLHYFDSKPGQCIHYEGYHTFTGYELNSYVDSIKEWFKKNVSYTYGVMTYYSIEKFIDKIKMTEIARSEYDTLEAAGGMLRTGIFPMSV